MVGTGEASPGILNVVRGNARDIGVGLGVLSDNQWDSINENLESISRAVAVSDRQECSVLELDGEGLVGVLL